MASDAGESAVIPYPTDMRSFGTTGTAVRVCPTGLPTAGVDYH